MEGICVERVKIYINAPIIGLNSMEVCCAVNEYATLRMEVQVKYQDDYMGMLERLSGSTVQVDVLSEAQGESYSRLFVGIVKDVLLIKVDTFLTITISGVAYSEQLDREKKKCSFQDVEQTYKSIMEGICAENQNAILKWNAQKEPVTGRFLLQYQETDWKFLKRLSSQMHFPVVADEKMVMPNIQVGILKGIKRNWNQSILFNCKKGISKKYSNILRKNNSQADFIHYSFKCRENYNLCDWFQIGKDDYFIAYKKILFHRGELVFGYKIFKEKAFWIEENDNELVKGVTILGTVMAVEKENIFVQLDIDEHSCTKYAFPWRPVYGNFVYSMPECGEKVMVHIPTENEQEAIAVHTIRKNGGSNKEPEGHCDGFRTVQNRAFITNKKKQLKLYPKEMSLESVGNGNMLELKDDKGIGAHTPQKIVMKANGNINLNSGKILISSPQEILLKGMKSSIQINRCFNIYNPNMIEHCGIDSGKQKLMGGSRYNENKNWVNNYQALAAIPSINWGNYEDDGKCMCAMSSIPMISDGKATISMSELLNGTKMEETSFPSAFSSMESQTLNGGYPPPNLEE